MSQLLLFGSAVSLGVLTSISPCPLATNLAAVTFIGKRIANPRLVFLAGLMYTLGRSIFYTGLSLILVYGLLSAPMVSLILQKYMVMAIGPILLLTGMFLLELIPVPASGSGWTARFVHGEKSGLFSAFFLGFVFAAAFCPVSGAIFFGSLLPLSLQSPVPVLPPVAYGIGTGLPVLALAVALSLGVSSWSKIYGRITVFEKWFRRATGVVFLGIGVYFILKYLFRIL